MENALGRFRHNRPAPDFRTLTQATLTFRRAAARAHQLLRRICRNGRRGAAGSRNRAIREFSARTSIIRRLGVFLRSRAPRESAHTDWRHRASQLCRRARRSRPTSNSRATILDNATGEVERRSRTRACAPSSRVPVRGGSLSNAARSTRRFGRPRAASSWIRLQPSPSISVASILSTWTIRARACCKLHSAGSDSSAMDMNRSSRQARPARLILRSGPGTPYFEDASAKFREALAQFDSNAATPAERSAALGIVLTEARKARCAHSLASAVARRRIGSIARLRPPRCARARAGRRDARWYSSPRSHHARSLVESIGSRRHRSLAQLGAQLAASIACGEIDLRKVAQSPRDLHATCIPR